MNIKDEIICVQLLPYCTGRMFSDIFLKDGSRRWIARTTLGRDWNYKYWKKKCNSMYWSNLFVWFSNSKCSLWNKITVAGWESVVCRVFCIACPVFVLLRHRDFIFDTLMTSIHSETLGSISFSYVCVWLTVGSVCVCGVSLRLLKSCSALPENFWNILYKQFF